MRKRDSTEGKGSGSEELQTGDAARSMKKIPRIVDIPEEDRTPLVVTLLEVIQLQQEQIQALKDEIARLKGQKPRPKIKPSKLEKGDTKKEGKDVDGKRPGSVKRSKTAELEIDQIVIISPEHVPEGSKFKGYQDYTVQDIVFRTYNTRFRLQRWQIPTGEFVLGKLPRMRWWVNTMDLDC
jgi:uncharacterized small protein (DUF1192 family)